jgi:hemerythrin-like domain-containing protein
MNPRDDCSNEASDVPARILSEHALLRPVLRETRFLADCLAKGDTSARGPLRAFALMLYQKLIAHLDLEDRILAPVVRDIIGWGPSLHAEMVREHRYQREHLENDIATLKTGSSSDEHLAASIDVFVEALMRDMDAEERRILLRADLLVDSPLSDGEAG